MWLSLMHGKNQCNRTHTQQIRVYTVANTRKTKICSVQQYGRNQAGCFISLSLISIIMNFKTLQKKRNFGSHRIYGINLNFTYWNFPSLSFRSRAMPRQNFKSNSLLGTELCEYLLWFCLIMNVICLSFLFGRDFSCSIDDCRAIYCEFKHFIWSTFYMI